ncbi:MAG: cob(I)yrinic acid a,c-diamide adenosyltransferase [Gemmatimonadota bacterium]
MKIYTRTGDEGRTKLYGGDPVFKDDPRVAAYGTLDELNATLGFTLALDPEERLGLERLRAVQENLFVLGSRLAAADPQRMERKGTLPHFDRGRVHELEDWIDELDAQLTPLDSFILPGGGPVGAQLHVARTICRRAERKVTSLLRERPELVEAALPYMNRLSDLLFTLARAVNAEEGRPEARWLPMRQREEASAEGAGLDSDE